MGCFRFKSPQGNVDIGSLSTNSMRHTPSNFTLNGWYASCSLQW